MCSFFVDVSTEFHADISPYEVVDTHSIWVSTDHALYTKTQIWVFVMRNTSNDQLYIVIDGVMTRIDSLNDVVEASTDYIIANQDTYINHCIDADIALD